MSFADQTFYVVLSDGETWDVATDEVSIVPDSVLSDEDRHDVALCDSKVFKNGQHPRIHILDMIAKLDELGELQGLLEVQDD